MLTLRKDHSVLELDLPELANGGRRAGWTRCVSRGVGRRLLLLATLLGNWDSFCGLRGDDL